MRCLKKLFRGSNFVQKCGTSYKKPRDSIISTVQIEMEFQLFIICIGLCVGNASDFFSGKHEMMMSYAEQLVAREMAITNEIAKIQFRIRHQLLSMEKYMSHHRVPIGENWRQNIEKY